MTARGTPGEGFSGPEIEISGVSKIYKTAKGDFTALARVDMAMAKNEFVCVVGPSGCGKTTLLNIIAGLSKASSGEVRVKGKPVTGPGEGKGVIFQQYALYPWLTVRSNVEFGLRMHGVPAAERHAKADKYIELVGLGGFDSSYPRELSGGMKQRVAIARAYATNPDVLLMDEPFGALDAQTRAQLQENLLRAWESERKTCFFITHDVDEAVLLATRVVIMSARPGRISEVIDIGLPYPRNQETKMSADFTEMRNAIWGKVYKDYLAHAR